MANISGFHTEFDSTSTLPEGVSLYRALANRPRRISPEAGHALERLGHAIEYLIDEFLFEFEETSPSWRSGRIESIQILMAINRQIYFDCPEMPRLKDRILALLRPVWAWICEAGGIFARRHLNTR